MGSCFLLIAVDREPEDQIPGQHPSLKFRASGVIWGWQAPAPSPGLCLASFFKSGGCPSCAKFTDNKTENQLRWPSSRRAATASTKGGGFVELAVAKEVVKVLIRVEVEVPEVVVKVLRELVTLFARLVAAVLLVTEIA